jgi:hypothetical protein
MSASLLDVLVGQQVRVVVIREEGDRSKGEEPPFREEEIVGQLLYLPDTGAKPSVFDEHSVYGADGKRHAILDDAVRRIEVLDPASEDVILFAKCTGEPGGTAFRPLKHDKAPCCVHEVHVSQALGRPSPLG